MKSIVRVVACVSTLAVALAGRGDERIRFDQHRLVEVQLDAPADVARVQEVSQDYWACTLAPGPQLFVLTPEAHDAVIAAGFSTRVINANVEALLTQERGVAQRGGPTSWFDAYKTYAEVSAYVDTLVGLRPDLATRVNLGNSLEGRSIFGLRITAPTGPATKPAVLYNGCQHAREWIAVMTPMYIADQLIRGHATDANIQRLLRDCIVYIVPIVNPDGYSYSWTTNRMWRKNRRGGYGVDLNRNWSVGWGLASGSSGSLGSETYRGTAPFSEPESTVLRNFIVARPEIRAHIDFHSYSQLVLAPWGHTTEPLPEPDLSTFRDANAILTQALLGPAARFYKRGPAAPTLYLASGVVIDWVYGERGIWSWTIELRPTSIPGFVLPPEEIIPTGIENFSAAFALAEWAARPLDISFPDGLPNSASRVAPTPFSVSIAALNASLGAAPPQLRWRTSAESGFSASPLLALGADAFEAALPAGPCAGTLEWYLEAATADGRIITYPPGAPEDVLRLPVGAQLLFDDFENDLGWVFGESGDTASMGGWGRGNPSGSHLNGIALNMEDDHSLIGRQCAFTDEREGEFPARVDIAGGLTTLVSPPLDLTATIDPHVSYWLWYTNSAGASPNADVLQVEIRPESGAGWTLVESVGPGGDARRMGGASRARE